MADRAIVIDGKFYAAFSKAGVAAFLRDQGLVVALGDTWADYADENGITVPTLPMEHPETPEHNTPVIEDGIVKWVVPE